MGNELSLTIDAVSREKGINPEEIVRAIEDAILTAAKKHYKDRDDLIARFNKSTGQVDLYSQKQVVDVVSNTDREITLDESRKVKPEANLGDSVQILISNKALGRIDAQTAKQIIFQRVKEAERKKVHDEFAGRVGDLINGTIKSIEKGDMIVDLGSTEAILPKAMQSPTDRYYRGDRIRAVVVKVHKFSNDPQVVLSRTDNRLLMRLFESEVPEIFEGTIQIKTAVREAGDRAKIAVHTTDKEVDPVGACVGIKGSRVQSIISELHGERIDIVEWSEDIVKLASNALKPAKVHQVANVDERDHRLEIIVDNDQLSLAIGKKGQNVRLASKLAGWRIDIKSVDEKKKEEQEAGARYEAFCGKITNDPELGERAVKALTSAGFNSIDKLKKVHSSSEIPELDEATAGRLYEEIQHFVNSQVAG